MPPCPPVATAHRLYIKASIAYGQALQHIPIVKLLWCY